MVKDRLRNNMVKDRLMNTLWSFCVASILVGRYN